MSRLAWTSLGDRILYQFTDPGTGDRSMNIAAPDGSNWKKLTDFGKEDHFIAAIPRSSLIAFWERTDATRESALETITVNGENRQTVITARAGADFVWSPDNQHILVQNTNATGGNTPVLGLTDEDGSGYRSLFAPTFISKAAWSKDSETIYYALPGAFPSDAVIPNDYYGKPIYTNDTFWKMNIRTGKKERLVPLAEMAEGYDVSDIFLSPTETDLYFVDRRTAKLYRITL
jgi:Tol biopolymer transport system component